MSTPRIALAIPAYNAAGHLPRLLDAVRAQTVPFDEVLLYDDTSTDATGDIARAFGATVIRAATNTGPSIGKNILAQQTSCEWIHFHDADDALFPDFVARTRALISNAVDVILFGTQDRDDVTGALLGQQTWNDSELRDDAIRYCVQHTVTNCGVYRREAFIEAGGFDNNASTKYNEDQAMHLRLALGGLRFASSGTLGVIIYRRTGSMSSGHAIECARAQYTVLEGVAARTGSRYCNEMGVRLWRLAGVLGGYQDWTYARQCLELAQRLGYHDPSQEHPVIRLLARVSPFGAIVLREKLIRAFKPALRRGMPTVP
ncbi:MAG: glycosyltransferase family 2 protein [Acidobacteriaceae bacterium]|jgi:glycosyltransferase involved in cell wall biosynthesis|nr:glycosyltransferase family 2 protein [Acidobacteriaceae bacterium]